MSEFEEPLISTKIHGGSGRVYLPGETLRGEFQLDRVDADDVEAVELSILWHTEGKGDEDLGIHHFQRWTPADGGQPLNELRPFEIVLPDGPLSYDGRLMKVHWCVRVRVFLARGRELVADQRLHLGNVPSPSILVASRGTTAANEPATTLAAEVVPAETVPAESVAAAVDATLRPASRRVDAPAPIGVRPRRVAARSDAR